MFFKPSLAHLSIFLALASTFAVPLFGQRYKVGDIVENFTLTDRATGQPVSLYDFEGKVVFLEWFAYWCPFCKAAAAQTGPNIDDYYAGRGGNNHGVPVVHVNLNLQGGQEQATQQFVDFYHLRQVLNDFQAAVADRFQAGGQPIFAIINGVADSPSHQQWELVYSHLGYGELDQPIDTFRAAIDSIQAGVAPPAEPPSITRHPDSVTVAPDTEVTLSVEATGGGTLAYSWFRDGTLIEGASGPQLDLGPATAALAGDYVVQVTGDGGMVESRRARLVVAEPVPGRIVNLSVRASAGVAGQPLIVGFVVAGQPAQVLVRAVGPTLADFGVSGALTDPHLEIFKGSDSVLTNDNWETNDTAALTAAFSTVGAFELPTASLDAAVLGDLAGAHTVHVNGQNGSAGVALTEVYDVATSPDAVLTNVSARNHVGEGSDVLVAGFAINGNEPRRVLVRAAGPALEAFGIESFLADPKLELLEQTPSGAQLFATNDNWETETTTEAIDAAVQGAFPFASESRDAALLVLLPAGAYTAVASGVDGATGEALVEVYEAQ